MTMDDHACILGLEFIRAVAPVTFEGNKAVIIEGHIRVPLVPGKAQKGNVRRLATLRATKGPRKKGRHAENVPKREY